jgi:hypothetical protein
MNFSKLTITTSDDFVDALKRLAKKYPSLKQDLISFKTSLLANPLQGVSLGQNCFKVRLKISSKNKGKSGGGRIITLVKLSDNHIMLLTIFDKSEQESISQHELSELLKRNL